MQQAYRHSTRALSVLLCVLGVVLAATTLIAGGGPLARGVLIGVLLALLGAGRLYIAASTRSRREPT